MLSTGEEKEEADEEKSQAKILIKEQLKGMRWHYGQSVGEL
jgi:hypothetical protein